MIMLKMASFSNLKFENAIKQTRTLVALAPQRGKTSNNKIGATTVQLLGLVRRRHYLFVQSHFLVQLKRIIISDKKLNLI